MTAPEQPQEPRADVADVLRRLDNIAEHAASWPLIGNALIAATAREAAALIREQAHALEQAHGVAQACEQRAERAEKLCKLEMETRERAENL